MAEQRKPAQSPGPWGQWLKAQIDKKGISPAELSRRSGVSEGRISHWLNGTSRVNLSSVLAICRGLSVSVVAGLVGAELIDPQDANEHVTVQRINLDDLADEELVAEVLNRLKRADHSSSRTLHVVTDGEARRARPKPRLSEEARGEDWAAHKVDDPEK